MTHLFVLDLTYIAGLELVEEHLQSHRDHLAENYEKGNFLASGRKEPRTGGVILAQGERQEIQDLVDSDPFSIHGIAQYTVTEFIPTMTVHALKKFRE